MVIALVASAMIGIVLAYQWAKAAIHREHVARGCWMVRNSIERAGE